ncbi:hypothetical protein EMGBD3_02520, partial [Nitrosarchaeum sp.]
GIVGEDGFNGIRLGPEPPGTHILNFNELYFHSINVE